MSFESRIKEGYFAAEKLDMLENVEKYGLLLWKKRECTKTKAPILTLTTARYYEHKKAPTLFAVVLQGEVEIDGFRYLEGKTIPFISSKDLQYLEVPKNVDYYIRAEFLEERSISELREDLDKNPELKSEIHKMWSDVFKQKEGFK